MNKGWIGVDLDGTLAEYTDWQGPTHIGAPVLLMVQRVKGWLATGYEVRIFTARVYTPSDDLRRLREADEARQAICRWCVEHLGQQLEVTCTKDFDMLELWDDRCVQVEKNTGKVLSRNF